MQLNLLDNENSAILQALEWSRIIHELSNFTHFDLSKENFLKPVLTKTPQEITEEYQSLGFFEVHYLSDDFADLKHHTRYVPPRLTLTQTLERIKKHGILDFKEINDVVKIAEAYFLVYPIIKNWSFYPNHGIEKSELVDQDRKATKIIRRLISPDGEINYRNHPELNALHEKKLELEAKIRNTINNLSQDPMFADKLQFTGHDIINDRYVIAIRTDSYEGNLGQILGRSDTGMTLYVEPYAVRELCNKRFEILAKIDEIINNISIEFSSYLMLFLNTILKQYATMIKLDESLAKTEFNQKFHLNRPTINQSNEIKLYGFFHPLIPHAIINDLELPLSHLGLVISGPNTGGKTAILKAIVLSSLFMHFGLYIPATEAHLPLFDGIFFLGNDGQDISQGLSSFSSEVKNYLELFTEFGKNNLIVIDEIFNSTSSEEASALALGLFEEIARVTKAKILISTHHQMLKTLIHTEKNFLSAHVGFDIITHRPNYKLMVGMPGSSMALSIFKNLTENFPIKLSIVERASGILDKKLVLYESLLQEVSKKKNELDLMLSEQAEFNQQLKNQKSSHDALLKIKMNEVLEDYEKKLETHLKEAEKLLDKIHQGEINKRKQLEIRAHDLKANFKVREDSSPNPNSQSLSIAELTIGHKYFCHKFGKNVELKSVNLKKSEVSVQNGTMTIKLSPHELSQPRGIANKPSNQVNISWQRQAEASHEYDCRGMRLDEFENLIEKAISSLILGDVPFLHIIHGHGDGVLKSWLRKYLKSFPELTSEIPEHSHDGATRIYLRSST